MRYLLCCLLASIVHNALANTIILWDCYYAEHPGLAGLSFATTFHPYPPFRMYFDTNTTDERNTLIAHIQHNTTWGEPEKINATRIAVIGMCDAETAAENTDQGLLHWLAYTHKEYTAPIPIVKNLENRSHFSLQVEDYEALQLARLDPVQAWHDVELEAIFANWAPSTSSPSLALSSDGVKFEYALDPKQCQITGQCTNCSRSDWQMLEHVFICDAHTLRCQHRLTSGLCVRKLTPKYEACTNADFVRIKHKSCIDPQGDEGIIALLRSGMVYNADVKEDRLLVHTFAPIQEPPGWVSWRAWAPWSKEHPDWIVSKNHLLYVLEREHGNIAPPRTPVAVPSAVPSVFVVALAMVAVFCVVIFNAPGLERVHYAPVRQQPLGFQCPPENQVKGNVKADLVLAEFLRMSATSGTARLFAQ